MPEEQRERAVHKKPETNSDSAVNDMDSQLFFCAHFGEIAHVILPEQLVQSKKVFINK